ncbi:MAG: hypothetical protein EBX53_07545 [Betaproteobacteria bacterium]|nr:hypothetical protein [Betaproteobacteria bacterium]
MHDLDKDGFAQLPIVTATDFVTATDVRPATKEQVESLRTKTSPSATVNVLTPATSDVLADGACFNDARVEVCFVDHDGTVLPQFRLAEGTR